MDKARLLLRRMGMGGWVLLLLGLAACGGPRSLRLPAGARGYALAFAPDGNALLVLYEKGSDYIAEYRAFPKGSARWRMEGVDEDLFGPAFSPDGQEVALALWAEKQVAFFDAATGEPRGAFSPGEWDGIELFGLFHLHYLSNGRLALLTHREDMFFLEVWNRDGTLAGEPIPLGGFGNPEWWRPFSRDGQWMAYLPGPQEGDRLGVLETATGERREWSIAEMLPPQRYISTIALSPDGEEVAVGLSDLSNIHPQGAWDASEAMLLRLDARSGAVLSRHNLPPDTRRGETVVSLAYGPEGRSLAASTLLANDLLLYDLAAPAAEPRPLCRGEDCCRHSPAFAPDGHLLATVCGRRVVLWGVPR